MSPISKLVGLLWLPICISAFSNTSPLLVWSSPASRDVDMLPKTTTSQLSMNGDYQRKLRIWEGVCDYDGVVVVEQPGLRASDLRGLSSESYIAQMVKTAPSSAHVPLFMGEDVIGLARSISRKCGSLSQNVDLDDVKYVGGSEKVVVSIELPELESFGKQRKKDMTTLDAKLSNVLQKITKSLPSHLVIITGTPSSSFSNVQHEQDVARRSIPQAFSSSDAVRANAEVNTKPSQTPKSGIFHRYQLLTPGLITTLVIAFLVLLPLILGVVYSLAGIKSPIRSDGIKHSQEKKNQ